MTTTIDEGEIRCGCGGPSYCGCGGGMVWPAKVKNFSWLKDRVLIWDQDLSTDSKGNPIVVGDKCHYCGYWCEYDRKNYREVDGSCSNCGAQ